MPAAQQVAARDPVALCVELGVLDVEREPAADADDAEHAVVQPQPDGGGAAAAGVLAPAVVPERDGEREPAGVLVPARAVCAAVRGAVLDGLAMIAVRARPASSSSFPSSSASVSLDATHRALLLWWKSTGTARIPAAYIIDVQK